MTAATMWVNQLDWLWFYTKVVVFPRLPTPGGIRTVWEITFHRTGDRFTELSLLQHNDSYTCYECGVEFRGSSLYFVVELAVVGGFCTFLSVCFLELGLGLVCW